MNEMYQQNLQTFSGLALGIEFHSELLNERSEL